MPRARLPPSNVRVTDVAPLANMIVSPRALQQDYSLLCCAAISDDPRVGHPLMLTDTIKQYVLTFKRTTSSKRAVLASGATADQNKYIYCSYVSEIK